MLVGEPGRMTASSGSDSPHNIIGRIRSAELLSGSATVICIGAGRACSGHHRLRRPERGAHTYPGSQRPHGATGNTYPSHGGDAADRTASADDRTITDDRAIADP